MGLLAPQQVGSLGPSIKPLSLALQGGFLTNGPLGNLLEREVSQSCLALCNPMDCSLPGSSIYGIFQARVLEWGASAFSRGNSRPGDQTQWSNPGLSHCSRRFNIWATREAFSLLYMIWKYFLPDYGKPFGLPIVSFWESQFLGRLIRSSGSLRRR